MTSQALVTFNNLSAQANLGFTTAGFANGRATFLNLSVLPPNLASGKATFFRLYTPNNDNLTNPYFMNLSSVGRMVLTPGFQSTLNILNFNSSVSMALISPSALVQGLITLNQDGIPTFVQGPPDSLVLPFNCFGLATGISASGSTTSVVIPSFYYPHIVMGITSTQAGALNIQRYIDTAGLVAQGSALTTALTANTAATIDNADGKGFGSFTVQITNTGTVPATISGFAFLLLAR